MKSRQPVLSFLFTALIVSRLIIFPNTVSAAFAPPLFPACNTNKGSVKANFPQGNHAVVGVSGLQFGADQVFSIGNNNFYQCFCPPQGSGVKTDWLAAGSLSLEDKNNLIAQGWILVPNGADWGLDPQPYLIKNTNFSCQNPSSNGSNGGSSGGSSGGTSGGSSEGSAAAVGGGQVLGISTLAGTSSKETEILKRLALTIGISLICYGFINKTKEGKRPSKTKKLSL